MGEVTDYLATLDGPDADAVRHVYDVAREIAPEATEGRSYGMAALLWHGKGYASAIVTKNHLSLFPFSGHVLGGVGDRLGDFDWAKGTLRFSSGHPVPDEILRDIFRARIVEIESKLKKPSNGA
ncbi:iron chaperone [Sinomonas sp. P10A9]|uniref:Iron chaperone n=1 Tax=Sinomonas puerhi TaxID=3238584 RepID=A0AB39L7K5_9MICC